MRTAFLKRILISIPLLVVVSMLTFVLVSLAPGDAAYTLLGSDATPQQVAQLRENLGLDRSLPDQYWRWLSHAAHGDFGKSLLTGQSVSEAMSQRLQPTVALVLTTLIVTALAGTLLGVTSAVRGGALGRWLDIVSLSGLALPNFVLGLILIAVFAITFRLLPASGYVDFTVSPGQFASSLTLPVVALSLGAVGRIAKQVRASMSDVLRKEFITTLRANGFSSRSVIFRHALRNASLPIVAALGVTFVSLLSGAVLVESVFAIPGLGTLAVQASTQGDLAIVQGVAVLFTVLVIAVNTVLDVCYSWLNPRVGSR